jgi:hypothetical protein
MQYHFMLMYDDATKMWSIDNDTLRAVMTDGTIYDKNVFPGWHWPEEGSDEEALDADLLHTLQSMVSTFPVPQEV